MSMYRIGVTDLVRSLITLSISFDFASAGHWDQYGWAVRLCSGTRLFRVRSLVFKSHLKERQKRPKETKRKRTRAKQLPGNEPCRQKGSHGRLPHDTRQDFFGILNMLLSFTAGVFMFKVTASGRLQDMPSD